jgi:hypothetical protein
VGPRAGLEAVNKKKNVPLLGLELQPLSRPPSSQLFQTLTLPAVTASFIRLQDILRSPTLLGIFVEVLQTLVKGFSKAPFPLAHLCSP